MIKNIELFDGKKAEVLDIYGGNDGYYWDYQIIFKVETQEYTINIAGSYSGWISTYNEITINKEPSKLSGITYNFNGYDAVSKEDVIADVQQFYKDFIESEAKINYVYAEDEDGKCYMHIDGVKKMTNAFN